MRDSTTKRAGILVLALSLTLAAFVPIGVYLQWAVPNDFPPFAWMYLSIVASLLVVALIAWRKSRVPPGKRWPMRVGAVCLFVLCALLLVVTSVPPVSRRVGPWAELRSLLVEKSREVVEAKAALSIPAGRQLTRQEMDQIETLRFDPIPTFTFPIIHRTVHVRLMSRVPPYVGVDFHGGRRAVFDLATMMVLYAD